MVAGAPAPIVRANVSMRAVAIPAGEVEVWFRYRTPGLRQGALYSAISALLLLLLGAWWWRGRSQRP